MTTELDKEAQAFIESVEEKAKDTRRTENYDKFKPEMGVFYKHYALLRPPNWEIPSQQGYGPSVACDLVDLNTGDRLTWWFSSRNQNGDLSIFRERMSGALNTAESEDHTYPMHLNFVIHKRLSRNDREYYVLTVAIVASGDNIEGNLGVHYRDNPKNDTALQSDAKAPKPATTGLKATKKQWSVISKMLGSILGDHNVSDAREWLKEHNVDVSSNELSGKPSNGGLPRIGLGTLSKIRASEVIDLLILESKKSE